MDNINTEIEMEELLFTLPEGYEYEVESFSGNRNCFKAKFSLKFLSINELEKWKQVFEEKTCSYYTKRHSSAQGTVYTLKWTLQCYHNTRGYEPQHPKKILKTTNCPSRMLIKMKRPYPGENFHVTNIDVDFVHNHPVTSADVSRCRKPTKEISEKFKQLFSAGHTPISASHVHWLDVLLNYPDNFESVLEDRRLCPEQRWAVNTFQQAFPKKSGLRDKENEFEKLQQHCNQLQAEGGEMKLFKNGNQFAAAIVTPLMMRVCSTKSAGEIVHVVSNRGFEKTRSRLFVLITSSSVGELPIGVVIISSETEAMIRVGFTCLQNILPPNAFGERGPDTGPAIFITDDNTIELSGIQGVWPTSTYLLCPFHILQMLWRWMWDEKQLIPSNIRPHLFGLCKNILCSTTKDNCKENYFILKDDFIAIQYPAFGQHVAIVYEKWQIWALDFTIREVVLQSDFNNYGQASVRFVMDLIFGRSKAFSIVQLCDIVKRFDLHYVKRIESASSNKLHGGLELKHLQLNSDLRNFDVLQIDNEMFKVSSETDGLTHVADVNVYTCSCPIGLNGSTCSHLYACIQNQQISIVKSVELLDSTERAHVRWLANGKSIADEAEQTLLVLDSELSSDLANTILVYTVDPSNKEDSNSTVNDISEDDKLMVIVDDLRKKTQENPGLYGPAIKSFYSSYMNLSTDVALTTALHNFGVKYTDLPPSVKKRKITAGEAEEAEEASHDDCRKGRAFIERSQDSVNTIKEHCYSILAP